MSIVRVGATKQYSDNWENIFSGGRKASTKKSAAPTRKSAKKSSKAGAKKRAAGAKRKSR
jgi:hypothetical protein